MNYYFLDLVPWQDSQTLYHAAAHLGRPALFLLRPAEPYVSVGFHQDVGQEIDLDYAAAFNLPVFRREVGGGAVYLDSQQLFYQLILPKNHPAVPADKGAFFRKFLTPVVETLQQLGLPAEFRPVNDILVNGRKISGNGAAEIESMVVLVGNFILDFNFEAMVRVLRVPDEKFRDKVHKTMSANLTTLRREMDAMPDPADLAQELVHRYSALLGPLLQGRAIDPELRAKAQELYAHMTTDEWLFANSLRFNPDPRVKIREAVYAIQKIRKFPGGLVRLTAAQIDGHLSDVHMTGDFFIYPAGALETLEKALERLPLEENAIKNRLSQVMAAEGIDIPGISPSDLAQLFVDDRTN